MADVSQDMLAKNDENPVKIRKYDSTAWMAENNGATQNLYVEKLGCLLCNMRRRTMRKPIRSSNSFKKNITYDSRRHPHTA